MIVISLTTEHAAEVRGQSSDRAYATLDPREIGPGQYILPLAVLADPAHAAHHVLLAGLPQIDWTPPQQAEA